MAMMQYDKSIDDILKEATRIAEDEANHLQCLIDIKQAYAAKDYPLFLKRTSILYQDMYNKDLEYTAAISHLARINLPITALVFNAYIKGALEILKKYAHLSFEGVSDFNDIDDSDTLLLIDPRRNEIIHLPSTYILNEDSATLDYTGKSIFRGDRISSNASSMWLSRRSSMIRVHEDDKYAEANNPLVDRIEISEEVKITYTALRSGMCFREVPTMPEPWSNKPATKVYASDKARHDHGNTSPHIMREG